MMIRYQAITLHDLPYRHTRVAPQPMRWWLDKMRLVRELRDRRHYAEREAQETSVRPITTSNGLLTASANASFA